MSTASASFRVYYEDTDSGGVVYYANYLKFAERARTEALRTCGIEQSQLWDAEGIGFVVRHCETDFLAPAKLDDLLTIHTYLEDIGKVSLTMQQSIFRDTQRICALQVRLAVVDRHFRPTRLPVRVHDALRTLIETT